MNLNYCDACRRLILPPGSGGAMVNERQFCSSCAGGSKSRLPAAPVPAPLSSTRLAAARASERSSAKVLKPAAGVRTPRWALPALGTAALLALGLFVFWPSGPKGAGSSAPAGTGKAEEGGRHPAVSTGSGDWLAARRQEVLRKLEQIRAVKPVNAEEEFRMLAGLRELEKSATGQLPREDAALQMIRHETAAVGEQLAAKARAAWEEMERASSEALAKGDYDGAMAAFARSPYHGEGEYTERGKQASERLRKEAEERFGQAFAEAEKALARSQPEDGLRRLADLAEAKYAPAQEKLAALRAKLTETAAGLKTEQARREQERGRAQWDAALARFDRALFDARDFEGALRAADETCADARFQDRSEDLQALGAVARLLRQWREAENAEFKRLEGRRIPINFKGRRVSGLVKRVFNRELLMLLNDQGAEFEWTAALDDLPKEEREKLIAHPSPASPAECVAAGLLLLLADQLEEAEAQLQKADPFPLAPHYRQRLQKLRETQLEARIRQEWAALAERGKPTLSPSAAENLLKDVGDFEKKNEASGVLKPLAGELAALKERLGKRPPEEKEKKAALPPPKIGPLPKGAPPYLRGELASMEQTYLVMSAKAQDGSEELKAVALSAKTVLRGNDNSTLRFQDLKPGLQLYVRLDPKTSVADTLTVTVVQTINGTLEQVKGNTLALETQTLQRVGTKYSYQAKEESVVVTETTAITGAAGETWRLTDVKPKHRLTVTQSLLTGAALKIVVTTTDNVSGVIEKIDGKNLVIMGMRMTGRFSMGQPAEKITVVLTEQTKLTGQAKRFEDLQPGRRVMVTHDLVSGAAHNVMLNVESRARPSTVPARTVPAATTAQPATAAPAATTGGAALFTSPKPPATVPPVSSAGPQTKPKRSDEE